MTGAKRVRWNIKRDKSRFGGGVKKIQGTTWSLKMFSSSLHESTDYRKVRLTRKYSLHEDTTYINVQLQKSDEPPYTVL